MRNKYPGICYRCSTMVIVGDGHFERFRGALRVQHASCAIEHRGTPDHERLMQMRRRAQGTGNGAQKARRALREMETETT